MKNIAVLISGAPSGDNLRDVQIEPGTSAGDVLRALNLQGYLLSREGSAQALAQEEGLYDQVEDGAKLRATPISEVGDLPNILRRLLALFSRPRPVVRRQSRTPVPKPPHRVRRAVIAPPLHSSGRLRVERDRRTLWQIRGWRRKGNQLIGAYRTPKGSCVGRIEISRRGRPEFFISHPPRALLRGPHSACFRSRGRDTYYVHMGVHGAEIDSGIVAIEKLLVQAL